MKISQILRNIQKNFTIVIGFEIRFFFAKITNRLVMACGFDGAAVDYKIFSGKVRGIFRKKLKVFNRLCEKLKEYRKKL